MLKRILTIGLLSGLGQLFSVFVIKWVASIVSAAELSQLAQIDSLAQMLINFIALGLQSSAMRNIALFKNWQTEYLQVQSARLTLALLLMPISLLAFTNTSYIIFLLAPMFALSGDYALYALGRPVKAAWFAFLRVFIPYTTLLFSAVAAPNYISWFYFIGLLLTYFFNNFFISKNLGSSYFILPDKKHFSSYIKTLPLGLVNLSLYINGIGLLLVIPYFYSKPVVAVAFVGLKFYVLFKGILRIIHQAFMKDMLNKSVCLKLDLLSILAAVTFLGSFVVFPESSIELFFGSSFLPNKTFFILLGIASVFYSFNLSMATHVMLKRKDIVYTILTVIAATTALISVTVFSFLEKTPEAIASGLIIGELSFCVGLAIISKDRQMLLPRLIFLINGIFLFSPFYFIQLYAGDTLLLNVTCTSCFVLILVSLHRKTFISLTYK